MTCLGAAHRHSKPIPTAKHLFCVCQCHFGGKKCLGTRRLPANYYYITLFGGGGGGVQLPHLADGTISTFPLRPSLSAESEARISNEIAEDADERKIVKKPAAPAKDSGLTLPTSCLLDWLSFGCFSIFCVLLLKKGWQRESASLPFVLFFCANSAFSSIFESCTLLNAV